MPDRKPLTQHGFLELPVTRDLSEVRADVAILGVPYDLATTGRSGTREGPLAVRRASWQMSWEARRWPWRFALADRLGAIDYGDVIFDPGNHQQMVDVLQQDARTLLDAGKTILSLGGDHYISLPLLREHARAHGPISLVHFDAHSDTEPIEGGFNHGSMFREALLEGLLDPTRCVQIGIRTEYEYDDHPFKVLDAAWVNLHSARETGEVIRRTIGETPAYVTFDIDCLDPAFAPGTGTPVPGGISTQLALEILRELVGCNLIGMDVVEVAPAYDHAEIAALAAATIALELLYIRAATPADLAAARGTGNS
ncbi:MAG: agmatinase [Deltaproteobacteria bacterium]|nr:agmatinase [Deltaproteobacteria bacterium]